MMPLLTLLVVAPLLVAPLAPQDISFTIETQRYDRMDTVIWVGVQDDNTSEYIEFVVDNKDFFSYMASVIDPSKYTPLMKQSNKIIGDIETVAKAVTGIADSKEARAALRIKHIRRGLLTYEHFGVENETQLLRLYFEALDADTYIARDNLKEDPDVIAFFIDLGYLVIRDDYTEKICLVKPQGER